MVEATVNTEEWALRLNKELTEARTRISALEAQLAEMTRRRDEWRKKAEGYDDVRLALREKVGTPWPPNMSRALWAGIAADEKKRADDAEARLSALEATPPAPNRVQGMVRSMDQWRNMVPVKVAAGSVAQIEYALIDAKTDIEALWRRLAALTAAQESGQ